MRACVCSCTLVTVCACAAVHVDELDMEKIAPPPPLFFFFLYSLSITQPTPTKRYGQAKSCLTASLFSGDGEKKAAANEMKAFIKVAFMLVCLNVCKRVQG